MYSHVLPDRSVCGSMKPPDFDLSNQSRNVALHAARRFITESNKPGYEYLNVYLRRPKCSLVSPADKGFNSKATDSTPSRKLVIVGSPWCKLRYDSWEVQFRRRCGHNSKYRTEQLLKSREQGFSARPSTSKADLRRLGIVWTYTTSLLRSTVSMQVQQQTHNLPPP